MIFVVIYFGILSLAVAYVIGRGGAPERWVAAMFVLASIGTALVPWHPHTSFRTLSWGILAIDVALLIGLTTIALAADRFWPIWLTALQFIAVAIHGVRAYDPKILAMVYWVLSADLAYPMITLLVIATTRHRKRLDDGLPEYPWTYQRRRENERSAGRNP